jgi:hypothetical protein
MGDGILWVCFGARGLRWGWSVALFLAVYFLELLILSPYLSAVFGAGDLSVRDFTAIRMSALEAVSLAMILVAASVVALVEGRSLLDFNLRGPRGVRHFLAGLGAGFAALSLLVGALAMGGWIHFGGVALSGTAIMTNALLWGLCFLLVGCAEEGIFRCYLQSTLARSITFWQALGTVAFFSIDLLLKAWVNLDILAVLSLNILKTSVGGAPGVYALALLGVAPCLALHLRKAPGSSFWYAAWVTSTLFGFVHTGNGGENWVGIFQAAFVGVIFCVSIRVTGSAWWAIGCHAGWDWAQTYFYGTPDSGLVGKGHLLDSTITGNPLWSGGADGPEGSVLGVGVLLLLLAWLLARYGRRSVAIAAVPELTAD